MKNKEYTGVWIPKEVLNNGIKNGNERILLAMIISLSNKEPCSASNFYFSELLGLSKGQISRLVSHLEEQGYIKTYVNALFGNKRTITINKDVNRLCGIKGIAIGKSVNTLYANTLINSIEDNIYINTSTTTEKLRSNMILLSSLCKEKNINEELIFDQVDIFSTYLVNTQKEIHNNDNDLYAHFISWLNRRELKKDFDLEEELNWFIKMFNKVSRKSFKVTPELKTHFTKLFTVGFTGDEMVKATQNLFSSSVGNLWHIKNSYKFATPEYLLKGDNLNKYLNVRWGSSSSVGKLSDLPQMKKIR